MVAENYYITNGTSTSSANWPSENQRIRVIYVDYRDVSAAAPEPTPILPNPYLRTGWKCDFPLVGRVGRIGLRPVNRTLQFLQGPNCRGGLR